MRAVLLASAAGALALGLVTACSSSGGGASSSGTDGAAAEDSAPAPEGGVSGGDDATTADGAAGDDASDAGAGTLPGWTLTWSDEFDGPDGSAVDPAKWSHDVGGSGWGNQEREYYTAGMQNAVVEGGDLVITATTQGASQYKCWYGPCLYTSARLLTKGHFAQQYGRFEARIQLPAGQGLWPAFWLLGSNIDQVSWPACGETDIMENIGKEPSVNHGSLHAPGFPGGGLTGQYTLPGGARFADAFHTFAVEWDASAIRFYVDDQLYETQTPANADGGTWAFDHPFFILLNVAVGGTWPGDPNGTTTFPQTMKVDWVRVYAKDTSDP